MLFVDNYGILSINIKSTCNVFGHTAQYPKSFFIINQFKYHHCCLFFIFHKFSGFRCLGKAKGRIYTKISKTCALFYTFSGIKQNKIVIFAPERV